MRKKDGQTYQTEFVSCEGCMLMYHWPGEVPRQATIDPTKATGSLPPLPPPVLIERPRVGSGGYPRDLPNDWKLTNGMTEEDLVRIKEAAARANKSKGKRYRR